MTTTMNTVKLSRNTFDILKNFATINTNLLVESGNKIKTLSAMKNIMSEAVVAEDFDTPFGIWDLNKFLGTISLFDSPELTFEEKYVTISGKNGASVRYHYSDPSLLLTSTQELKMPEPVVKFELTQKQFAEIQKAASVLQVPDICLRNDGEVLQLVALDKGDRGSNSYSIDLGEVGTTEDFEFYFKVENLKILPGDYDVSVTEKIVSQFTHQSVDLKYWIAMESDSRYGE